MAIPTQLEELYRKFWEDFKGIFDLSTDEGSGKHTELWVKYAKKNNWSEVENLKKSGSQTQYNGHAVDAFLFAEPFSESNPLYQAVDIIGGSGGPNPSYNWGIDEPRYTDADIWTGSSQPPSGSGVVPWQPYDENSFQALKDQLAYDYGRRPQAADFDVTVWSARVFHSAYMGPNQIPLGLDAAIKKHRPEWCAALGVPLD